MCNWRKWIWPGILATVLLTALAMLMKSGSIEQDLQAKALGDLSTAHQWAQVELDGRDLKLTGTAPSEEAIAEALGVAANAYDVRVASADVKLLPIASPFALSVTKDANKMVLDGSVPSEEARSAISELAKSSFPGAELVDNLVLARGAPEGFSDLAGFGIGQLKDLTKGTISLSGLDLSVKGDAPSVEVFETVDGALNGTLPSSGKLASADITAPTITPYVFSATKSGTGIVLDGYAPSTAEKTAIVDAATKLAGSASVTDNLKLAKGSAAGFSALAGFGISQLADLTEGSVSLNNSDLTVVGTAPSVAVFDSVSAALNGAIPGDGKLAKAEISSPIANPYTFTTTKTSEGIVLDGFAPSEAVRTSLVEQANSVANGKPVTDNLKIAGGNGPDFSAIAGFGISQLTDLTEGSVSLNNSDLTVVGTAPSVAVFDSVSAALNGAIPGDGKLAKAEISSPMAKPYTFTATKTSEGIVLDGFAPSEAVRASLVEQATSVADGKPVTDNLKIARGNGPDFSAIAGYGIAQLGGLASGTASLSDVELGVTGAAKDSASFDATTLALASKVPAGAKLVMDKVTPPVIDPYVFSAVESETGVVLFGYVPDEATRARLVATAAKTTTATVTDKLKIAAGEKPGFADLADFGIGQLSQFSSGNVDVTNNDLAVAGTALTPESFDEATAALAGAIPGNGNVIKAEITRSVVRPYTFAAKPDQGIMVLDGYVTSDAERAAAINFATVQNPGDRIIDRLIIANGKPNGVNWSEATQFAIGEASKLSKGTASIKDTKYTVEGMADSNESFEMVKSEANGKLPGGISLSAEKVLQPIVSPYTWTFLSPEGAASSLKGYTPDKDVSDANIAQVETALGKSFKVEAGLINGAGAPKGFAAATSVGIQTASRLINGKAEIVDTKLMVSGEALSDSAAAQIRAQVKNGVPPGFTGEHNITVRPVAAIPQASLDQCQQLLTDNLASNKILFETNKSVIKGDSFGLLDRLAYVVKQCPAATISIEGHTDSDGSEAYNQALSDERANAVRAYLVNTGIFISRLKATGFGESKPIADNSTDDGKSKNRRIEFNVVR